MKTSQHNKFLSKIKENENFNQYWYSENTINILMKEIHHQFYSNVTETEAETESFRIAFLSTPSVYSSCTDVKILRQSCLFDIDSSLALSNNTIKLTSEDICGYVSFDFNKIDLIDKRYYNKFDMFVIDPPFVTIDAWKKYAEAVKIIVSNLCENGQLLQELFGKEMKPLKFLPCIPTLVYQYCFFANFDCMFLDSFKNEEVLSSIDEMVMKH
ncbi:hypothetical protein RFI_03240 [Reticulomyxa filosa]|uniref:N6-adenine methyltransferase n=1 Tax=Reticulomyxa filosa TaxID=46433 RepID=X6P6Z5_RETFI|nr:hypothetical protein RFI_03240 [Reticulomyxa filosa]|eukprot:ETO33854.1 hypothetical protein RFI_03240 [Reticulomyxa filosa]